MFLNINLFLLITLLFTGCSSRFENMSDSYWLWDDYYHNNLYNLDKELETLLPNLNERETISHGNMELIEVDFQEIAGWTSDDTRGSLEAFVRGCGAKIGIRVPTICEDAKRVFKSNPSKEEARRFFETYFVPYLIVDRGKERLDGLVTGYYVPLLHGSRKRTKRYRYPIYEKPKDFTSPYKTHEEIDKNGIDARVICWVDDRVDRFFLHIQGSGMVKLDDGTVIGVGYADKNGHPYSSIGRYIHQNYGVPLYKLSANYIKKWLKEHPDVADEVLYSNKSYVFFREQGKGMAIGAMGVNLVPKSTIAVDTRHIPLGLPIYIKSKNRNKHLNHLFMAQDKGGAIKGVIRADLFFGFGDEAGKEASIMKQIGEFYMLIPNGLEFPE